MVLGPDNTWIIISIHSLLTKGDDVISITRGITAVFQSTPFSRRETAVLLRCSPDPNISIHSLLTKGDEEYQSEVLQAYLISIHSLLTKGDIGCPFTAHRKEHFNPLPSHEGRLLTAERSRHSALFQSTPFSRRETALRRAADRGTGISIHSLLTKGDREGQSAVVVIEIISIHSLLTKGDQAV